MQTPSPKIAIIICALVWVLVQGMLLYTNGIVATNEGEKYIGQAYHLIQQHKLDDNKYIFYFIPILVIYLGLQLNIGFAYVIAVQLIINALATIVFYKIAKHLFGYNMKSILAVLLYITFIPIQEWNVYLYTESLFYSFCIFFMYACYVMDGSNRTTHITRGIVLLLLVFTRPLGILFIPVLFFLYLSQSKIHKGLKWLMALVVPIVLYFIINFLYRSNADMDILMPQEQGMVICYGGENIQGSNITIPTATNPVESVILFATYNPVYFFKLASLRLLSFFNLYKPGYSAIHNIYLVLNMLLLYLFSVVSFIRARIKRAAVAYTFSPLLAILCLGVMLQCNDYNNRFCMPVFPWLILFAVDGLFSFKKTTTKPTLNHP